MASFCFSSVSPGSHSTKRLVLLFWLLSVFCQKFLSLTLPITPFASVASSLFIFYPIHSLGQTASSTTISNTVIYNIMRPVFLKTTNKQTESHIMTRIPQPCYRLDTLMNCKWTISLHLQLGGCLEFQSASHLWTLLPLWCLSA